MKQRVSVAKIVGSAGLRIVQHLHTLQNAAWQGRKPTKTNPRKPSVLRSISLVPSKVDGSVDAIGWSSDDIPVGIRRKVDRFAIQLKRHSEELPVIYLREWIDNWASGYEFIQHFEQSRDPSTVLLCGVRFDVMGCAISNSLKLKRHVIKAIPGSVKDDCFLNTLLECLDHWRNEFAVGAIVVLREPIGSSVDLNEINDSIKTIPDWIARLDR